MRDDTCKGVLIRHMMENSGRWHRKSELYSVAEDWSPETVGRRLRELEDEDRVTVGHYDGRYAKGLSMYRYGKVPKEVTRVEIIDGRAVMTKRYE